MAEYRVMRLCVRSSSTQKRRRNDMSVTTAIVFAAMMIVSATASPLPTDTTTKQPDSTAKDVAATRGHEIGHGVCRLKTADPFIHNQVSRDTRPVLDRFYFRFPPS